jgi:hypothetical protein
MMTPEEYLAAMEAAYENFALTYPRPECHEHIKILDEFHGPTPRGAGWACMFGGEIPIEWYSHRKPEPKRELPEPPAEHGKWDWM